MSTTAVAEPVVAPRHAAPPPAAGHAAAPAAAAPPASLSGYRVPPSEILDIVDAPAQPSLSFSPDKQHLIQLVRGPSLPPIFEMARPELKLAGLRLDPELYSRSKAGYYLSMSVVSATEVVPAPADKCRPILGHPEGAWLNHVTWSPDGKSIAFAVRSPGGPGDPPRIPLELWVADLATGVSRPLMQSTAHSGLNTVFDDYTWVDDNTIVACMLPAGLTAPPQRPSMPVGPRVQDNSSGKTSQNRTYPDLLKDEYDVALLDHYGMSEIVLIDVHSSNKTLIAPARMYTDLDVSPDGRFLLVSWLERPYSFAVPCGRFPRRTQLWDRSGNLVREMAALPLAVDIPISFSSCRKGPRSMTWRDDRPAEMYWIEAQDGGDAAVEVSPRDIVYTQEADGAGDAASLPRVLATTDLRCGGVAWCDGDLALLYESWWKTRRSVTYLIAPDRRDEPKVVLHDLNYEDVYTDPGSPISRRTALGTYILAKIDGKRQLLLAGGGASPEGSKPFLDLLDLDTRETRRVWQSTPPHLESAGVIMNDFNPDIPIALEGLQVMVSREDEKDPPQTFVRTLSSDPTLVSERRVTNYPHPYPQLRDMPRQVLRYPRDDGVMLTGTLYTPPGWDKERDGPLPCILWAYPREYKSKEAAGQMRRSPHQFTSIGSMAPTLWVARGYAVLDGPSFPIVAEGAEEPNDTFLQQLVASAKAAVDEVVRLGVADPTRMSVGGHSYGAFMAANLVAHAPELFAAGICRSGAYNRTLTPFGFQSEERTLWQAPEVYQKMAPYMAADKVKKPLLLIHGEDDNNPGTFPLQSERYFQALQGHGAQCRLVVLPHESHGYRARESVLHSLFEQDQWLERFAGFGRGVENLDGTATDATPPVAKL